MHFRKVKSVGLLRKLVIITFLGRLGLLILEDGSITKESN